MYAAKHHICDSLNFYDMQIAELRVGLTSDDRLLTDKQLYKQ